MGSLFDIEAPEPASASRSDSDPETILDADDEPAEEQVEDEPEAQVDDEQVEEPAEQPAETDVPDEPKANTPKQVDINEAGSLFDL